MKQKKEKEKKYWDELDLNRQSKIEDIKLKRVKRSKEDSIGFFFTCLALFLCLIFMPIFEYVGGKGIKSMKEANVIIDNYEEFKEIVLNKEVNNG